jgi:O-acetyl-ADP-ribose deacetylase (regulator of RNase III)
MMGFGSGIAGQIRKEQPAAYRAFMRDNRHPEQKLGDYSCTTVMENGKYVFNLYGQMNYGREPILYTDYAALEKAVRKMLFVVSTIARYSESDLQIGMPWKMGCDLGGGDWNGVVLPMLTKASEDLETDIWLYEFKP